MPGQALRVHPADMVIQFVCFLFLFVYLFLFGCAESVAFRGLSLVASYGASLLAV